MLKLKSCDGYAEFRVFKCSDWISIINKIMKSLKLFYISPLNKDYYKSDVKKLEKYNIGIIN